MRRVVVVGGSKGIGAAIAAGLVEAGDEVAVLSRTPVSADGPRWIECDLTSESGVIQALAPFRSDPPDALIYSAVSYGANSRHPVSESTVAEWDSAMEVTARGLLLCLRELLPGMLERDSGRILEISSDVAAGPGGGRVPYAASKAAARAIMMGLAEEIRGSGVASCQLLPLLQVDTPGIRSRRGPDFVPDGYADPRIFVSPTLSLLDAPPDRIHGTTWIVDASGALRNQEEPFDVE